MTERHPITPSPELVQQWDEEGTNMFRPAYQTHLATQAARWGADQELEACCEWLEAEGRVGYAAQLRAARRPKPPSLKEQALEEVAKWREVIGVPQFDTIRRAIEQLPDTH